MNLIKNIENELIFLLVGILIGKYSFIINYAKKHLSEVKNYLKSLIFATIVTSPFTIFLLLGTIIVNDTELMFYAIIAIVALIFTVRYDLTHR